MTERPPPTARCLDLTRLISRAGRGPLTGVDRVELAYLRRLLDEALPLFALVRTGLGHVLLDRDGAGEIRRRIEGRAPWGPPDLVGRLSRRASPAKRRAEADLRRLAVDRCRRGRLAAMLRRSLPAGAAYLNVGHSNLSDEVFDAWRAQSGATVAVFVHDTIPLDFPDFQRPGTPARFKARMRRVAAHADLVICNSRQTRADVTRWFGGWGRVPQTIVAHLGIDLADPGSPGSPGRPRGLPGVAPYFVVLGTIEPRKNHALLLDVWEALAADLAAADMPHLVIAGSRGWANEAVFARLDALAPDGPVHEFAGLPDAAVSAMIRGAAAVLFPSRAEGFGLPAAEAAALGTPVLCHDLPVFREILGNIPVYLESDDVYSWKQSITRLADEKRAGTTRHAGGNPGAGLPTWADHFNLVLKVT